MSRSEKYARMLTACSMTEAFVEMDTCTTSDIKQ